MNNSYIIFNLSEARNALDALIEELRSNSDYEYGNYRVDMEHLYHHINSAWNARDATDASTKGCSKQDFLRWRQFPADLEMLS